ncbi:septation protein SepH [Schaalia sp. lx-260]|uniref:septation protein SepH n=1 Tax=Schaalia sp. lx-260 TaxID=2899082 RepID=UPI001E5E2A7D|nr:septation protein SepH [Schaalia sp. lx-260]MCD4549483.1 DUF3071 domain-containing protein [Schaalia sp. lx-260]
MIELDLLGVGADGQTLVFTDAQGERYSVPITDELRGSVRRDRPHLEAIPSPSSSPLRPKDIQALLRAGATAQDIAHEHGLEIQQVLRYEGPVRAEQEYALTRARQSRIGNEADSPIMGELVVDRLAARGVDAHSLVWSARRENQAPWQICLTFIQGASEHGAHWTLTSSGTVEAIDQEAQWLTETVTQTPSSSIFTPLTPDTSRSTEDLRTEDLRARDNLIDQLNAVRGKRQPIEFESDDDELIQTDTFDEPTPVPHSQESSISAQIYSLTNARSAPPEHKPEDSSTQPEQVDSPVTLTHTEAEPPIDAPIDDLLPGMETLSANMPSAETPKKKSKRRSVPSWDEIVFGSKNS